MVCKKGIESLIWSIFRFFSHREHQCLEHLHPLAATGTPTGAGPVPNRVPGRGSRQPPHRSHSGSRLPANPKLGTKHCPSLLGAAYLGLSGVWSEEMTTASSRPRSEVWRGRPGFNRCRVAGGGPCRPKSTGRAVGVPVGANGGDALMTLNAKILQLSPKSKFWPLLKVNGELREEAINRGSKQWKSWDLALDIHNQYVSLTNFIWRLTSNPKCHVTFSKTKMSVNWHIVHLILKFHFNVGLHNILEKLLLCIIKIQSWF